MNKLIQNTVKSILCVALSGLVACNGIPGSESGDLPPSRPTASVSGFVVDDAISGALINVYAFDGGVKGDLLGSATTGLDGAYSLEIDVVNKRPVLIEARGGSYVELSTGLQVTLKDDEVLKAVDIFEPGKPLSLMVTPLTHLVVALVDFHLNEGVAVEQAIATASSDINELFGFDVHSVYPRSIADQGSQNGINDEHMYGFFLSALSSWTKRISEQNSVSPHEVYNSIGLSQILFNELASDGLMDGRANVNSTGELGDLALGAVNLDASSYRISFAQHMLAMAAGNENLTNISVNELLPRAVEFLNSQHRIFAGVEIQLKGDQVDVTVEENLGNYRSGIFDFAVTLGSPDLISSVSFSIDDVELPVVVVPGDMVVPIDSRQYPDGERILTMVAKDWLGNTVANISNTFKFDNTAPHVNVTSGLYTNRETYILSGELINNGSELSQFEIEGQTIAVAEDNTWSIELPLDPGKNSIDIVLVDAVGNEFGEDLVITPDLAAPVIDTSMGHSAARFLSGDDQVVAGALSDNNAGDPVYIETDKIDLDGVAITRVSLEQAQIPYFAFKTHDPAVDGVSTAADALDVKMRYEKNGDKALQWRSLTPVDGEYLVPLASESLDASWHQAVPGDEHVVRVKVNDKLGNSVEKLLQFKTSFVVVGIAFNGAVKLNNQIFANTPFADRDSLHDMTFDAVEYSFTNGSDESVYISLENVGKHDVVRTYEQLVRVHEVKLKTTTEWQIATAENAVNFCDGENNEIFWSASVNPDAVLNYTEGKWVAVNRPSPTFSEVQNADSDTPIPPPSEPWSNIEDFDSEYASFPSLPVSQGEISFSYDYLIDTDTLFPEPVIIKDWSLDSNDENIRSCRDRRGLFQQRLSYSYESQPGFPDDILSDSETDEQSISELDYKVMNSTLSDKVEPISGWYRIPAGHSITITKSALTPNFSIYNDDLGITPAPYTIPLKHDKSIEWFVSKQIKLMMIHDAGEDNIFLMPSKEFVAGEGVVNYLIAR